MSAGIFACLFRLTSLPANADSSAKRCFAFGLSIAVRLKQNPYMENQNGEPAGFQGLVQWALKPPQAYAVYAICVILIGGLSFIAGTLNPKKPPPPPAVSLPHG
jgi:hypothetical protein